NLDLIDKFSVFPGFALSLIAFIIGSEMKLKTLRQMGHGIGLVTITESLGAFIVVALGIYLLTRKLYLALIFGALAPASAPAGTVAVLQECKAKGRLTNALYAVVGLDDGLAIIIFAVAMALSKLLFTGEQLSFFALVEGPVLEITGSILLGCVIGAVAGFLMRMLSVQQSILAVSIGAVLLCTGIATYLKMSLILANLSLGMTFVNMFPQANKKAYQAIESISLPVYIIFFFLAGASLQINLLPSMGFIGLVYVICRSVGLAGGAYFGATISRMDRIIRNYLGLGILSQAGVAIGLAVLASSQFGELGESGKDVAIMLINTIAATTIVFEIIGPIGTKYAISKAGEAGANITEDDLIETYKVSDVMDIKVPVISAGMELNELIKIVSDTNYFFYPVVDNDKKLIGVVTLDGIRNTFNTHQLNQWLVALDLAEDVVTKITPQIPLADALATARKLYLQHIPVVSSQQENIFVGVLDLQAVRRALSAEVLSRQQKADTIGRIETA
ncbi:MAG: cation:proton antiporter, partial [Phycisphaerales bacterium]